MTASRTTNITTSTATNQARIRAWLVRHPVGAFTVLAYAISWICWLPLVADRQDWVSWSASSYLHLVGGLGPATAALVVTAVVAGRSGVADIWRRAVAWRGRLRWLALAVFGPLAVRRSRAARVMEGVWPI